MALRDVYTMSLGFYVVISLNSILSGEEVDGSW